MSETLKDIDGRFSSKRVASFVALAALLGCLGADVLGHPVQESVVNAFTFITCSGLGLACAERFAPKAS